MSHVTYRYEESRCPFEHPDCGMSVEAWSSTCLWSPIWEDKEWAVRGLLASIRARKECPGREKSSLFAWKSNMGYTPIPGTRFLSMPPKKQRKPTIKPSVYLPYDASTCHVSHIVIVNLVARSSNYSAGKMWSSRLLAVASTPKKLPASLR